MLTHINFANKVQWRCQPAVRAHGRAKSGH